jgi:ATP-dependent RNA helicase RhlE
LRKVREYFLNFNQLSLDSRIHRGIDHAGFVTPTPIQEQAIPPALAGRDILGLAQTGTGKTAAFVLPILQKLITGPKRRVRSLILAPTRELAEQIHQDIRMLGKGTGIQSVSVYGGVSKNPQLATFKRGAEIVVACPGRLLDHLGERAIDLSGVEILVLDEADRMCDMGFLPDIRRILKHLPKEKQTLFFSATMPNEIRTLADTILNNPQTVQIGMTAPVETVSHALYPVSNELKKPLLFSMLENTATGKVLIFTRTKHRAKGLAAQLMKKKYRVASLQGNLSQNRRQDAITGFRGNKYDILVATDIAARGIDVSEITHVINFDMPDTVDAYTHRIGRTGRALKTGSAYTFATSEDAAMIRSIEKVLDFPIEQKRLPDFDYGNFEPEIRISKNNSAGGGVSRSRPPRKKSGHAGGRPANRNTTAAGRRNGASSGRRR